MHSNRFGKCSLGYVNVNLLCACVVFMCESASFVQYYLNLLCFLFKSRLGLNIKLIEMYECYRLPTNLLTKVDTNSGNVATGLTEIISIRDGKLMLHTQKKKKEKKLLSSSHLHAHHHTTCMTCDMCAQVHGSPYAAAIMWFLNFTILIQMTSKLTYAVWFMN